MPSRAVIHGWAVAAATAAGSLPVGLDAIALASEEIAMVIHVAKLFGQEINEEVAKQALKTGLVGTVAGSSIFVAFNIGYPFTIPAKIATATVVMETLGNSIYTFYEKGGRL